MWPSEGYVHLRQAVAQDTVQAVLTYLTHAANWELSIAFPELLRDEDRVHHIHGLAREKDFWQWDKITQDAMIGQLSLEVRTSPKLWALLTEQVRETVKVLLQVPRVKMHMAPAVRCILPQNQYAMVPAHQDIEYNPHLCGPFVTCWFALMDATEQCGGLAMYPGSHTGPVQPVQYAGAWRKPVDTTGYTRTPVYCKAGDMLIFPSTLIHESMANTSDHRRISMDCRVFGPPTTSTKHYLDTDTWTVHAPTEPTL